MSEVRGVIVSFKRGPKTQKPKNCLIRFPGVNSIDKAAKLIGRKIA